jgi:urocanate hydratase
MIIILFAESPRYSLSASPDQLPLVVTAWGGRYQVTALSGQIEDAGRSDRMCASLLKNSQVLLIWWLSCAADKSE